MNQGLHQRVCDTIARHAMIRPGDRIGLGVSGGADSVAMLRIFADLQAKLGITILVLHFHHQLRGADADEDERFAKELAGQFHFEFESGRADVFGEAKLQGRNLEDAARSFRYAYFASIAKARGLNRIAVAHTADDQAETVLSHLLRGTGLTGLAGVYPVAGQIIRPLLECNRRELREFLSSVGQTWREDVTNQDTSRMRARIRHQLIPLLLRDFDPAAVTRLARLATHAREDEMFWQSLEATQFQTLATRETTGAISINISDLLFPLQLPGAPIMNKSHEPLRQTAALTRRLVRRIYSELRGSREKLTSRHVDSVLGLATKSQSGARIDLPGIYVERIFDRLCFSKVIHATGKTSDSERGRENQSFAYRISRPGNMELASIVVTEIRRRFHLKIVDWPPSPRDTVLGGVALDFERVQWPLVLRNWHPGDSYRPEGRSRPQKVKRLLLQSRIPRSVREGWPVLTSQEKVIWVSGFPAAEGFAPRPGTQSGLILVIEEEEF